MAPSKGNQHAKGYGRPPKVYSDAEVVHLGEELIAWMDFADAKKERIVHLSEWYRGVKKIPKSEWRALRQRLCFLPYYEQAMDWLLVKMLKNDKLQTAYGSRYLGIYDQDIREHEKEIAHDKIDYEISKKQELEKSKSQYPNDDKLDELIKAVKEK